MKKKIEYQPIYPDILESQKQTNGDQMNVTETINGVSYLPGEFESEEQVQLQKKKEIRKDRENIILITILHTLFSFVVSFAGMSDILLIYIPVFFVLCALFRYITLKRPIHKESFPLICIILTGVVPYGILTGGSANPSSRND